MMKYILGALSTLASLLLGAVAVAENYTIQVLNLPILQQPNKTLTFNLSVSSSFSGSHQNATLYVDDCGDDVMVSSQGYVRQAIPLTLVPDGKQEFSVTTYRDSTEECILTFKLFDETKTLLTSTQVGVLPLCPNQRNNDPIDAGLDYTLPEEAQQQNSQKAETSTVAPSPSSSQSSTVSVSSQSSNNDPDIPLLTYSDNELTSAFNFLVEKGILKVEDKEKLQQPLTRIAAAELFVHIALTNGTQADINKSCDFPDMKDFSQDQQNVAVLACQMSIMGVNPDYTQLDNFMPNLIIPSEQLVTAFSRLMWRSLYEDAQQQNYYELHMNMLYNLDIIDAKAIQSNQKLADFVIIAARAIAKEQLAVEPIIKEEEKAEKSGFRFW